MPSIGGIEMLVIAIVAIVVVGPKDLPKLLRGFGNFTRQLRAMARDFQDSIDDLARESELQDLRQQIADVRRDNVFTDAKKTVEEAAGTVAGERIDLEGGSQKSPPPETASPAEDKSPAGDPGEDEVHTVRPPDMAGSAS